MSDFILLDAGPLGLLSNPQQSPASDACNQWLQARLKAGRQVLISEVADYEVRRELLRAGRTASVRKLDSLQTQFTLLPITSTVMRRAAQLWAMARNLGKPTAHQLSLDADVILAAQAVLLIEDGDAALIATSNPKHLTIFTPADFWQNII